MSSKLDTKLEFDRSLLLDVGIYDKDDNGFMLVDLAGSPTPVTIGGKRLVLTLKNLLREGDWEERIAFHPECEQITQGPSPILNALKNYIVERTKETFKSIIDALGELASDTKRQKPLSAKAAQYLSLFNGQEFDATTLKTLRSVLKATSNVPEKRFINLFLQNGGKDGALRTCQVSFPFMENDDASDPTTFFGVKMPRKTKDKALIVALLEYVLGNEEERNSLYTQSVKDGDAPYLNSLLKSFDALAERQNKLIEIHGKACQTLTPLKYGLEWAHHLPKFDEFVRTYGVSVPALPGNVGVDDDEIEEESGNTSSVYESDADDLGAGERRERSEKKDVDLPWDDDDGDRRESRRSGSGRSMGDLLKGKNSRSDDRRDRERDRDRDDRRDDRRSGNPFRRDSRDSRDSRDDRRGSSSRRDW